MPDINGVITQRLYIALGLGLGAPSKLLQKLQDFPLEVPFAK